MYFQLIYSVVCLGQLGRAVASRDQSPIFPSGKKGHQYTFGDERICRSRSYEDTQSGYSILTQPICPATLQLALPQNFSTNTWSHDTPSSGKQCVTGDSGSEYCIFTIPSFAEYRGLTLLTTPDIYTSISASLPPSPPPTASSPPGFFASSLPNRGIGLIANKNFQKGDLILESHPLFIIHESAISELSSKTRLSLQQTAMSSLPSPSQNLFLSLAAHFTLPDKIEDILLTNGFSVKFGSRAENHAVIIPESARINHACRPNARFALDPKSLMQKVHAVREIEIGEEITFSYIDQKRVFEERQRVIKGHWGFECSCHLCSLDQKGREESDNRVERILELRTKMLNFQTFGMRKDEMESVRELVHLYEKENLHDVVAEAYMLAAFRSCVWGLGEESRMWAEKAVGNWVVWEKEGPGNLENLKVLEKGETKVWCWDLGLRG